MWTTTCRQYDKHSICHRQLNLVLEKTLWYDNEMKSSISTQSSKIHVELGNMHHHLAVVFTSVQEFLRIQTVKRSESSLGRHSKNLT
jgi:hypothetical protein